jgi:hypothetical protein
MPHRKQPGKAVGSGPFLAGPRSSQRVSLIARGYVRITSGKEQNTARLTTCRIRARLVTTTAHMHRCQASSVFASRAQTPPSRAPCRASFIHRQALRSGVVAKAAQEPRGSGGADTGPYGTGERHANTAACGCNMRAFSTSTSRSTATMKQVCVGMAHAERMCHA